MHVHRDGALDVHIARHKAETGVVPCHQAEKCLFPFQVFGHGVNHEAVFDKNLPFVAVIINGQRAGFIRRVERLNQFFEADRAKFARQTFIRFGVTALFVVGTQAFR